MELNKAQPAVIVLVSGGGTNLQALLDAKLPMRVVAVISDNPQAFGLLRAQRQGLMTECILPEAFPDREAFNQHFLKRLQSYQPEWIVLAGFMRILDADTVHAYTGKIINLHPARLPQYAGLNTHRRVLEAGDRCHGSTVHFVTVELDAGPIIAQTKILIDKEDTVETLEDKVKQKEHLLYPMVVRWLLEGRVQQQGEQVLFDQQLLSPEGKQLEFESISE